MNKKLGRPKVGAKNAKGEVFSARFTPAEAKVIQAAIATSPHKKSDWIRMALLSVAQSDKPVS